MRFQEISRLGGSHRIGSWDFPNPADDAVYTTDLEYRLVSFNESFRQLIGRFGASAEAGCDTLSWYSGEARLEHLSRLRKVAEGQLVEFTSTHRAGDDLLHLWNTFAPLRDEHGKVYGTGGFIKDITPYVSACRETELSLASEKERACILQEILHNLEEPVIALDENLHVIMVSKPMIPMLVERGVVETRNFPVTDLLERSSRATISRKLTDVLSGQTLELPEGVLLSSKVVCQPLCLPDGSVIGVKVRVPDKTMNTSSRYHETEEELRHRIEMLSVTQRQLTCFLEELSERARIWDYLGQSVPGLAFAVNQDYKLLYVNPALSSRTPNDSTSQKGFEFLENLDEQERRELSKGLADAFNDESGDEDHPGTSEREGWVYQTFKNAEGKVTSVVVLTQPLAEPHTRTESPNDVPVVTPEGDVKIREEVFGLSSLIFELGPEGYLIYSNGKLRNIMGEETVALGRHRDELRHDDVPEEFWNTVWKGAGQGKITSAMIKLKSKRSDGCWVDMTVVPVRNQEGEIVKYVAACYRFKNGNIASYLFYQQLNRFRGKMDLQKRKSLS